jgi:hypothetical protein
MNHLEAIMKKLIKKLEDIMVAITFAEAGEFDEANREIGAHENARQDEAQLQNSVPAYGKTK